VLYSKRVVTPNGVVPAAGIKQLLHTHTLSLLSYKIVFTVFLFVSDPFKFCIPCKLLVVELVTQSSVHMKSVDYSF
jgi:hypothetical protein